MNALLLIGLAVFFGTLTGKVFQKLKIPQVVGYILIGLIIGKSFFHLFEGPVVEGMMPLVNFTLGIIGFIIGAQLKRDVFAKYGKAIYGVLLGEGLLAFLFVTVAVTLITRELYLGLLFGAIAAATDPASTTNVLWEYRAKGLLTTTLTSVVALDDGLAILIYGFASVFAKALVTKQGFSFAHSIGVPLWEITQCLLLGIIVGAVVVKAVSRIKEKELAMAFALGALAIVVGIALWLELDLILPCMALGATIANVLPHKSESLFGSIREMSAPLYILFFVVIGAQLDIHIFLQTALLFIVMGYLLSRSVGKILGAMVGGILGGAKKSVVKYAGISLFTQGGVAMGLALSISHNITRAVPNGGETIGILIMNVVAATTFVVQLAGPALVKFAVFAAGENNKDITRDDIIDALTVKDVMQTDFIPIPEGAPLSKIIATIKKEGTNHSPVINAVGEQIGSVSLTELKEALYEDELKDLLVAEDVAVSDRWIIAQDQPLRKAMDLMEEHYVNYLPVVEKQGSKKVVGMLENPLLAQTIHHKLISGKIGPQ